MHEPDRETARRIAVFDTLRERAASVTGRAAAVFRHSIRDRIPRDPARRDVPLRPEGRTLAARLGARWDLPIGPVLSSPMKRCRETATHFLAADNDGPEARITTALGDPGPFVLDSDQAWANYFRLRKHAVVRSMLTSPGELEGYRPVRDGVAVPRPSSASDG